MFQHLVGGAVGGKKRDDGGKREREKRWDELLPGVGRCHGVSSGNSIVAQRTHR